MDLLKVKRINLITFGLPLLVILASVFVALSSLTKTHPEVTALLAYDLAVLSPLLYFFLIRKRKISKLTVIPFIMVGIVLATILLPEDQHGHLNILKAIAIPAIEVFIIAMILRKAYFLSRSMKANALKTDDGYSMIRKSSKEVFGNGKFTNILISEIAVLYYALIAWKKKALGANEFSNYKDSGTVSLLWGLILVMFIETMTLHFLLAKWNILAAWVLTVLSIYSAIMVFGHLKALARRPSLIAEDKLILKNGLIATITIDMKDIEKVELFNGQMSEPDKFIGNLGLAKESNDHNVAMYFSKTQTIEKFYGITQKCDRLVFFIDDKNDFLEKVKSKLNTTTGREIPRASE